MSENCMNCGQEITNNFCASCGQKKYKRIDKKYIWDEIQYTVLHTNKGFLYTVKSILKNPGKTAHDFINGNRVKHYKPLTLAFVLSSIATYISYKLLGFKEVMGAYYASKQNVNAKLMENMMSFIASYNAIIMLMLIPFFALTTYIAFKKWGNNYYEHVVLNAFILSFYTLVSILIIYPILYIFKNSAPGVFFAITQLSMLLMPVILVWFFKGFYADVPLKKIIIKVLVIIGLLILSYLILLILIGIVVFIIALIKGPGVLKVIQPK